MTTNTKALILLTAGIGVSIIIPYFSILTVIVILFIFWYDKLQASLINYDFNEISSLSLEYRYQHKQQYLQSPQWKEKKRLVHLRDKQCICCGNKQQLEVHHITYRNLWYENLSDLILLCRHCHQQVHNKYGYNKYGYFPLDTKNL